MDMVTITRAQLDAIRKEERERLADLLIEHADTISGYAADKRRTVHLVAHLFRHFSGDADLRPVCEAVQGS